MRTTLLGLVVLTGCGVDVQDTPPSDSTPTTWYQDVAPIVANHCMSCHQDGGIAPFSLTEYQDAHDNAQRMVAQIKAGTMPPFDAREEPDCTPRFGWKDDPRLSYEEVATIEKWIDDGTLEGTKAAVPSPPSTSLTGVTKTLVPTTPWSAAGDRDQFICFVLDPQIGSGAWINGLQVRPGNNAVVHHVVLTELQPGAEHDATIAAHGIGQPWDCSAQQQPGNFVMNIWTPGNVPMQTPGDLAIPLVGGAKIVMQIHYHPAGTVASPDATSVDLRTSTTWPKKMYFVTALGNAQAAPNLLPDPDDRTSSPEFRIPANKADHEERMTFTIPDLGGLTNVGVYSVNPHMHLIGTHINSHILRPAPRGTDPQNECLANGNWNFDWQRTYIYDTSLDMLPTVKAGDTVDVTCRWNNTFDNPFEQRALADAHLVAPVDVSLGEGNSTDEMCLEIFGLSVDAPPAPAARTTPLASDLPMADLGRLLRR